MPQTVQVRFTPESDWQFIPEPIRVKAQDEIVYHRNPSGAPWRFTGATITPPSPQFTIAVQDDRVTIGDTHSQMGTFCVVLTVEQGGRSYPSPDPRIVNEPSLALSPIYVAAGLLVGAIAGALIDMNTGLEPTRGPFKGAILGAIIGAIIGALVGRMLAGRKAP